MGFKINKPKLDLGSYPYYVIMGEKKVGKTTLFKDLVLLNHGDAEKGLLISCSHEKGYKALEVNYGDAAVWKGQPLDDEGVGGFVEIVDEIISMRGTKDQIEMVAIDTLDGLVELATQQVYEEHRDINLKYPISLNDALGGYGRGVERVNKLIREQLVRLDEAGMAVFVICHTKVKSMTDILTGNPYEMVTNDLDSRFYNPIANDAQMIVNIVKDRTIDGVTKTTVKDKKTGKEIEKMVAGRATNVDRYMYFRDTNFIDAGGRFVGLPERLPLSAENFMEAFKTGVANATGVATDEKEIEKQRKAEVKKNTEAGKKLHAKELAAKKQEITSLLKEKINSATKDQLGTLAVLIKENNITGLDEEGLADVGFDVLSQLVKAVTEN